MYKITIEHIRPEIKIIGKVWAKTGQIEKIREPDQHYDANKKRPEPYLSETYAYTPEVQSNETVTRKIYEQTIDHINLHEVVGVINGTVEVLNEAAVNRIMKGFGANKQ